MPKWSIWNFGRPDQGHAAAGMVAGKHLRNKADSQRGPDGDGDKPIYPGKGMDFAGTKTSQRMETEWNWKWKGINNRWKWMKKLEEGKYSKTAECL